MLKVSKLHTLLARRCKQWPIGFAVTRQDFEAAVELGQNFPIR